MVGVGDVRCWRHQCHIVERREQGAAVNRIELFRAEAAGDGVRGCFRGMAGHGADIPEAEIVVIVAIDIGEVRAAGAGNEYREWTRPFRHPVHRHAPSKDFCARRKRFRSRVLLAEQLSFTFVKTVQSCAIDPLHDFAVSSFTAR